MPRILVVEDDANVRKFLARLLVDEGYLVEETSSAPAALKIIGATPPDLVITDLLMPNQDGLELIMKIRRAKAGPRIIAISGGGRIGPSTYLEMADKLGADRVLTKPFRPEALLRTVRKLLG